MNTTHNYEINLEWNSERIGEVSSPVLNNSIEIATPPEFPKGIAGIWSPEHLFVASVSSCLMTTFLAIAENSKLEFLSLDINANGTLDRKDGKFLISKIELKPILTIPNETNRDKAERILNKSEAACLISNSILSEISMEPKILISDPELVN
tara:strand:+ start:58742 stop:59197 length:456 start_codon:yes stop_codon:yes gene_type:complete